MSMKFRKETIKVLRRDPDGHSGEFVFTELPGFVSPGGCLAYYKEVLGSRRQDTVYRVVALPCGLSPGAPVRTARGARWAVRMLAGVPIPWGGTDEAIAKAARVGAPYRFSPNERLTPWGEVAKAVMRRALGENYCDTLEEVSCG